VLVVMVLLATVALGESLLRHRSVPADADGSPGPSAPASAPDSASAAPEPIPSAVPATPWRLVRVGDPVTMRTGFTDPGTNDTHRCDTGWDDGTTTSGPAQGDICQATHAYKHAGMYTVTSTVTDDDGGVGRAPGVLVVVYDPAAGPVHASGPGFDVTARYPQPSAAEPEGTVTYALPPRLNLDLRNHQHLDWLVVTPDGRFAIKGTAEQGRGHRIGFVLYGSRIVVWDGAIPEGAPILYDSRPGASFDIDA
jgi:PKD domain